MFAKQYRANPRNQHTKYDSIFSNKPDSIYRWHICFVTMSATGQLIHISVESLLTQHKKKLIFTSVYNYDLKKTTTTTIIIKEIVSLDAFLFLLHGRKWFKFRSRLIIRFDVSLNPVFWRLVYEHGSMKNYQYLGIKAYKSGQYLHIDSSINPSQV